MLPESMSLSPPIVVPHVEEWQPTALPNRALALRLCRIVIDFYQKVKSGDSVHTCMMDIINFFDHDVDTHLPPHVTTMDQKLVWLLEKIGGWLLWSADSFGLTKEVKLPLVEYLTYQAARTVLSSNGFPETDSDEILQALRVAILAEEQKGLDRRLRAKTPVVTTGPESQRSDSAFFSYLKSEDRASTFRTAQSNRDSATSKDRGLVPVFEFRAGNIHQQDRHKAAKFVSLLGWKDPYRGSADNRSIRKILLDLKLKTESNGLDALEYQYLLNAALTDNVKRAAKDEPCFSYQELEEHLNRRIAKLIAVYGNSVESEIVLIRRQFSAFRQKPGEKIADAGERFEVMVTDLAAAGIREDPKQIVLQFVEGLNEQYRNLATAYFLNDTTDFFELRNKLIVAERMQSSRSDDHLGSYHGQQISKYGGRATNTEGSSRSKPLAPEEGSKGDSSKFSSDNKQRKSGSCWSCGEKGHSRDRCPVPEEKRNCTACGRKGHLAPACLGRSQDVKKVEVDVLTTKVEAPSVMEDAPPTLKCKIAGSESMDVLVDTGASCAIISSTFAARIAPATKFPRQKGVQYRLKFANSSCEDTNESVDLPVEFNRHGKKVTKNINFLIARELHGKVILGRAALRVIGIQLTFGRSPDEIDGHEFERKCEDSGPAEEEPLRVPVEICFASAEQELFVSDNDEFAKIYQLQSGSQLEDTTWSKDISRKILEKPFKVEKQERVEEPLAETVDSCAEHYLDVVASMGWIEFSNKYHIRVRRVVEGALLDTSRQKFCFEVSWSLTGDDPSKKPWNSYGLVKGLSPHHREEWDQHVRGFTEKQWWIPSQGDSSLSATLFPVIAKDTKTTRCRPCCDMRSVNSVSPKVSARSSSVADSVLRLRSILTKEAVVAQYDLNKAFYRIHVRVSDNNGDDFHLVLKVGATAYVSDRLVFGLAVGPSSLNASQAITGQVVRQISKDLFAGVIAPTVEVMDDFLFVGHEKAVVLTAQLYETVWRLTGFDWKSGTWKLHEPAIWLGQRWEFNPDLELLSMYRVHFDPVAVKKWTKREAFRQGGKFTSITGGFKESMARVHADAIRQIAGQWHGWDETCTDGSVIKVLEEHLSLAEESWNLCFEEDSKMVLLGEARELRIASDASGRGYGFAIWTESGLLMCDGKLFAQSCESWHCNRRELYSLSQGIIKLDSVLRFTPNVKSVVAFSDSKVAVSQADEWRNVTSKSLERKVLMRLRNAILEIKFLWKAVGISFKIMHIQGTQNQLADELSRAGILKKDVCLLESRERYSGLTVFQPYKDWLVAREFFLIWRRGEVPSSIDSDKIWRRFLLASQESDSRCTIVKEDLAQGKTEKIAQGLLLKEDGLLVRQFSSREQIWIPDGILVQFLLHIHKQMGHAALAPCLANFFACAFHPAARKILKQVIRACKGCNIASRKRDGQASYGPVHMPSRPFQVIGVDLYGPLQRPRGSEKTSTKKHVLTVVDRLTGYTRFILLNNARAESVVREIERLLFELGANVKTLVSDNGPQFVRSPLLAGLCLVRGIRHLAIPLFTPHMGGFYEVRHRVATRCLRALLAEYPVADWELLMAIAQSKVNSHVGPDRSASPHQLVYGWEYIHPAVGALANARDVDWEDPFTSPVEEAESRAKVRDEFLKLWEEEFAARQVQQQASFKPMREEPLALGDEVYLVDDRVKRKFAPGSVGPYRLVEQVGKHTWMVLAEDSAIPVKLHVRNMRSVENPPEMDVTGPQGQSSEEDEEGGQDSPEGEDPGSDIPPGRNIRKRRVSAEERFLASVPGMVTRSGRLRRGRTDREL